MELIEDFCHADNMDFTSREIARPRRLTKKIVNKIKRYNPEALIINSHSMMGSVIRQLRLNTAWNKKSKGVIGVDICTCHDEKHEIKFRVIKRPNVNIMAVETNEC